MRNRQCLYKQDATSHTKSCTSIYSVVIPIHRNREMASVYTSFPYSSLTTNLKYTVKLSLNTDPQFWSLVYLTWLVCGRGPMNTVLQWNLFKLSLNIEDSLLWRANNTLKYYYGTEISVLNMEVSLLWRSNNTLKY